MRPYLTNFAQYGGRYLNPAAFAPVPVGSVSGAALLPGTLGRGALRGIGSWNLDLSMAKNTKITEKTELQLRLDAFAAPNHPMWTSFNTNIFSSRIRGYHRSTRDPFGELNLRLQF